MSLNKNQRLMVNLFMVVAGMVMLTYASVPLYDLFCRVTGFGGTPGQAADAPQKIYDRTIEIRFNADIDPRLPWDFMPEERTIRLKVGEQHHTFYDVINKTDKPVEGHATYNVTPLQAGAYFTKIECFCYEKQTLKPKERRRMGVTFFLDPELLNDPVMDKVHSITLSYTFFLVENSGK